MTTETSIAELNTRFSANGAIQFTEQHGLIIANISNHHASATVALDGAQVLSYTPIGQTDVLFVASKAIYAPGKSVRGGIPVCWPWFAGQRDNPDRPFHGFARMVRWDVVSTSSNNEATILELALGPNETSQRYWPHAFELRLVVAVGDVLKVDLIAHNTDRATVTLTGALHTYFRVGDSSTITISGLEKTSFIDKLDGDQLKHEEDALNIEGPIDRIYLDTSAACIIDDPGLQRRIEVAKVGSNSAVVWNPWIENTKAIADMGDDEYQHMVCVETTNAGSDTITLAPGATHQLGARIRVLPRA